MLWLDAMFLTSLLWNGVQQTVRKQWNFIGATVVDNVSANRLDITFPAGLILQSIFSALSTDQSTTSTTPMLLFQQVVTVSAGSALQVRGNLSAWNDTANQGLVVGLTIDGGSPVVTSFSTVQSASANTSMSASFQCEFAGLSAGDHTISVLWGSTGSGSRIHCDAVTLAHGIANASMIIQEIAGS